MSGIKRMRIPASVKWAVLERQSFRCACGCNEPLETRQGRKGVDVWRADYDHDPALSLRPTNEYGTDYIPPQLDPDHIFALIPEHHDIKTFGDSKSTCANGDIHKAAKAKRIAAGKMFPVKRPIGDREKTLKKSWYGKYRKKMNGKIVLNKKG